MENNIKSGKGGIGRDLHLYQLQVRQEKGYSQVVQVVQVKRQIRYSFQKTLINEYSLRFR